MKPRIYKPSETDFSNNGLGILSDCSRCEVYEVANGKYELELEYPLELGSMNISKMIIRLRQNLMIKRSTISFY